MRKMIAVLALAFCAGCVSERVNVQDQWLYSDEVAWYLDDVEGRALPSADIPVEPHVERYRPSPMPVVPAHYRRISSHTMTGAPTSQVVYSRTPAAPRPRAGRIVTQPVVVRVSERSVGPTPPQFAQSGTYAYVAPRSTVSAPPVMISSAVRSSSTGLQRATYSTAPVRVVRPTTTTYGTTYTTTTTTEYRGDTGLAARRTTYEAARSAK